MIAQNRKGVDAMTDTVQSSEVQLYQAIARAKDTRIDAIDAAREQYKKDIELARDTRDEQYKKDMELARDTLL